VCVCVNYYLSLSHSGSHSRARARSLAPPSLAPAPLYCSLTLSVLSLRVIDRHWCTYFNNCCSSEFLFSFAQYKKKINFEPNWPCLQTLGSPRKYRASPSQQKDQNSWWRIKWSMDHPFMSYLRMSVMQYISFFPVKNCFPTNSPLSSIVFLTRKLPNNTNKQSNKMWNRSASLFPMMTHVFKSSKCHLTSWE